MAVDGPVRQSVDKANATDECSSVKHRLAQHWSMYGDCFAVR